MGSMGWDGIGLEILDIYINIFHDSPNAEVSLLLFDLSIMKLQR